MKWDGIPHHTDLGKGLLFLINRRSARTAREDALPTSDWRLHISNGKPIAVVIVLE